MADVAGLILAGREAVGQETGIGKAGDTQEARLRRFDEGNHFVVVRGVVETIDQSRACKTTAL